MVEGPGSRDRPGGQPAQDRRRRAVAERGLGNEKGLGLGEWSARPATVGRRPGGMLKCVLGWKPGRAGEAGEFIGAVAKGVLTG